MTREEALAAKHDAMLYSATLVGKDKRPVRVHVTGRCMTYKTRPDYFQLPVQYKTFNEFYITPDNAEKWCLTEAEAAAEHITRAAFGEQEAAP